MSTREEDREFLRYRDSRDPQAMARVFDLTASRLLLLAMHLVRDDNLIFHGCLAVDADGGFLPMEIDGEPYVGRALMEKLTSVVHCPGRYHPAQDRQNHPRCGLPQRSPRPAL